MLPSEVAPYFAEMGRVGVKLALKAGDVILESPWEAHSMSVSDLLMSQRRWGHQRCRRVLGPMK